MFVRKSQSTPRMLPGALNSPDHRSTDRFNQDHLLQQHELLYPAVWFQLEILNRKLNCSNGKLEFLERKKNAQSENTDWQKQQRSAISAIALCVDPHCKVSIGQYNKMCTSPLIFFSSIISDDKYLKKIFDHFHFHFIFDHLSLEQSQP